MKLRLPIFLLSVALLAASSPDTKAHSMPQSLVQLDFLRDRVSASLTLPMNELELSFKQPLLNDPPAVAARYGTSLRTYIAEHIQPVAPDGRAWKVTVDQLTWKPAETGMEFSVPDVLAKVTFSPPVGAPLRVFTLHYSVICHEVMSHIAVVSVRNDWNSATFNQNIPLGFLQYTITSVAVDRAAGGFWRGFQSVFLLGMRHIASGADHLLFLLVLLLPAPLRARGGRWADVRTWPDTLLQLLRVVTAFSIGHSLTLIIAGNDWWRVPVRPVEVLIAVSILVSALHAVRPWFAGRETWIAGGFGLVHGLAFASAVSSFGFSPFHLAMTVLGFNLGIEAMQLIVIIVVLPVLMISGRHRFSPMFRLICATGAGLAALSWIAVRIS